MKTPQESELQHPCRRRFVDLTALLFSDGHDGDRDGLIFHPIDQTATRRSQFDLVVMLKSVQRI